MRFNNLKIWLHAFRPKTLTAAIGPVLMGTAMAYGDGIEDFSIAFVCFFAALCIQIGTNLANDYFDYKKGADTDERKGPMRITQAGLISPQKVKQSFIIAFSLSAMACLFLVFRGGWPIAILAIASIASGILYTGGPRPLGYIGLGDLFVLIFFGPVAVGGTYFVQSLEINSAVILSGLGPGLISVAILTINNLRDCDTDAKSGKKTLAVRFGKSFAQTEYTLSILCASLLPVLIYYMIRDHIAILICSFISVMALPSIKAVYTQSEDGQTMNMALGFNGKLLLIYCVLFAIGWII